ncbi:protein of unknown function (DUF1942) [Mycolicibacterium chubuense NBB4]|uniref:MPT63-like domain-containing protein n=1 Tax=Mycolicibacterium chubuense (strain NBB4) TaxID=710421 RepID=I4BPX6_MYCCN|nr:MPT63 family protein [Mycolicibacterium chubuense]AFM19333.1 protein of unknown function (DUF1942) [Mycolicibacterium chubuense NBB4]
MKIKPALAALTTAAAAAVGVAGAPFASADADVKYLGQPGELANGSVVQHWTVTGLKPSTDTIPYRPAGQLWEATATDEAISGNVTPIVSNLNARAKNGDTYRVLFGVATPQGVNPSTLAQGQKTTGKIYFDVTGEKPDSVFYSSGGPDELLWVEAPPAPASSPTGGSASTRTGTSPSASGTAETASPAPTAAPAAATPAPTAPTATPAAAGSSGTPLPAGSSGTPLPAGSSGTPLPAGAAPAAEGGPAPAPAAVSPAPAAPAPAGSAGTPLPQGSTGTPIEGVAPAQAPAGTAPATTVVMPPPA